MMGSVSKPQRITFTDLEASIRSAYVRDGRPWVIGYSGGKDSTCALQLIWRALAGLPPADRTKPIYVLSSDTLVETPVIVDYVDRALEEINAAAEAQQMPISAHKVSPDISDSFWVNLIGRGYPAPSRRFRWCTERLKIDPANAFIKRKVAEFGEVVMVLGVRRAESATRAQVMALHKHHNSDFSRHTRLPGALVYTPIEDLSLDDVWSYLLQGDRPWGGDNKELVTLYRNAQAGECPLVVDTKTESCGKSRFGCWVCTVVTKDKAMEAMVDNGEEWLEPLLELRDFLAATQDPERKKEVRDFRRRNGSVTFVEAREAPIPGPYLFDFRKEILSRLLAAQNEVAQNAPPGEKVVLIQEVELLEIQRIWREELGDWQDTVHRLVADILGRELERKQSSEFRFDADDAAALRSVCDEHDLPPQLLAELLNAEREVAGQKRRSSIHRRIEAVLAKEWRDLDAVMDEREERVRTGAYFS